MKRRSLILSILIVSVFAFSSVYAKKKSPLIGKWQLIDTPTNDQSPIKNQFYRTMEFCKDHTFHGETIRSNGESKPYNMGKFYLPNDSTLLTIHSDPSGQLSKLSNVYNIKFMSDTLHLSGYYTIPDRKNSSLLRPISLNEYWIKIAKRTKR